MQATIHSIRGSLLLKTGTALALVALGDAWFFARGRGGGYYGLYFLALLAGMVFARPVVRSSAKAWIAIVFAAGFAGAMVYDASLLAWTMFWLAAGMATLLPATGRFDDGWRWFQRLFYHGLTVCFGPLIDLRRFLRVRRRRPAPRLSLRRSAPVLGLPLIGSAVIVALFSAANPVLEHVLRSIHLPSLSLENTLRLITWSVLFTASWALLRPRLPRGLIATFDGSGDLALPGVSVSSVRLSLVAFNLLFALQNAMDAAWLWGLVPLPEGLTLAQYAHRGAYPLIATALLAALFVLVTLRPGSTTARVPAIRRMVVLWIGQNLFLVMSSVLRTLDYVEAYSLTRLRIAALAWMALVGIGLVLICWRMLRGKSAGWLINANVAAAGLLLTGCCFVDLGAVAAQWNVRHAREVDGTGAKLDLCYLGGLGSSALLPLIELERRRLPGDLQARVNVVRQSVHAQLAGDMHSRWTWLGQHRLDEAQRLNVDQGTLRVGYSYDCQGRRIVHPADTAEPVVTTSEATLTEGAER